MRTAFIAVSAVLALASALASAQQTPPANPAPAAAPAETTPADTKAPTTAAHYTTADTEIGTLLDDPAAKTVLDKYIPELTASDQINMARGMTLRAIQPYSPDTITDEKLAAIDSDLARLATRD